MSPTIYLDHDDQVQVNEKVTKGTTFIICPECGETYTRDEYKLNEGTCPGCHYLTKVEYPQLLEWEP